MIDDGEHKKVLIYAPLAVLGHHQETDLEIAKEHLERGDIVTMVTCSGEVKSLGFEGCQGVFRCSLCKSRQQEGIRLIESTNLLVKPLGQILTSKIEKVVHHPNQSKHEWMDLKFENLDYGSAVLSTLISDLREPSPKLRNYSAILNRASNQIIRDYKDWNRYLQNNHFDLAYLFNGRFSMYRPFLRACQNRGVKFYVHERGSTLSRYHLSERTYPHDLEFRKNEILDLWREAPSDKEAVAADWFEKVRGGASYSWYSYTGKHKSLEGLEFSKAKHKIGIFISSEDEMECVVGWKGPPFENQNMALEWIKNEFQCNENIHFYVRVHPNLTGLKNSQTRFLSSFTAKNVTVIPAHSKLSSYLLVDACDKVITFGSTVGVEATYWGKSSILVGKALYEDLNVVYHPKDKQSLKNLILNFSLAPKDRSNALCYGFWISHFGQRFKYYRPKNLSTGLFLGHRIKGQKVIFLLSGFEALLRGLWLVATGKSRLSYIFDRMKNKILPE